MCFIDLYPSSYITQLNTHITYWISIFMFDRLQYSFIKEKGYYHIKNMKFNMSGRLG